VRRKGRKQIYNHGGDGRNEKFHVLTVEKLEVKKLVQMKGDFLTKPGEKTTQRMPERGKNGK